MSRRLHNRRVGTPQNVKGPRSRRIDRGRVGPRCSRNPPQILTNARNWPVSRGLVRHLLPSKLGPAYCSASQLERWRAEARKGALNGTTASYVAARRLHCLAHLWTPRVHSAHNTPSASTNSSSHIVRTGQADAECSAKLTVGQAARPWTLLVAPTARRAPPCPPCYAAPYQRGTTCESGQSRHSCWARFAPVGS
jgi:hypothetical protein